MSTNTKFMILDIHNNLVVKTMEYQMSIFIVFSLAKQWGRKNSGKVSRSMFAAEFSNLPAISKQNSRRLFFSFFVSHDLKM